MFYRDGAGAPQRAGALSERGVCLWPRWNHSLARAAAVGWGAWHLLRKDSPHGVRGGMVPTGAVVSLTDALMGCFLYAP